MYTQREKYKRYRNYLKIKDKGKRIKNSKKVQKKIVVIKNRCTFALSEWDKTNKI